MPVPTIWRRCFWLASSPRLAPGLLLTARKDCTTLSCVRRTSMTTLTIRLPDELRSELDRISRDENKAVSDIVRESLRRYVAIERFRAIRRKVLPFAEAQGLLTDDDVFKALE